MKTNKKALSLLVMLTLLVGLCTIGGAAVSAAGNSCGENLVWSLSDGVLTIRGSGAMTSAPWRYSTVKSVRFYGDVTSIYQEAFCGQSLTSVTVPASVQTIGKNAFAECASLTAVTLEKGVKDTGTNTFRSCGKLTSVSLPDGLTHIGSAAFGDCTSLRTIAIPDSVTKIDGWAFSGCTSLTAVTFGSNPQLTTLGDQVFSECQALTAAVLPDSVTDPGNGAFRYCPSLTSVDFGSSPRLTRFGKYMFGDCTSLRSLTVPDSVQIMDNGCFVGCANLESVRFNPGSQLVVVRQNSFRGCNRLTAFDAPPKLWTIGDQAFFGCGGLTAVTLNEGLVNINRVAFGDCVKVGEIHIPSSVKFIGEWAFSGCESARFITFDGGAKLETVEKEAFGECPLVKSVSVPDSVKTFGSRVFYQCTGLENASFGTDSKLVNLNSAFTGCTSLRTVTLGGALEQLGDDAFKNCTALERVDIPDSVKSVGFAFAEHPNLRHVNFSANSAVTSIEAGAFSDCPSLESIVIPNRVVNVGAYAFADCASLASVTVGEHVTKIGSGAFSGCAKLTAVTYEGTAQSWETLKANIGSDNAPLLQAAVTFTRTATELAIVTQPTDCTAAAGETVSFTLEAVGDGVNYRWQVSDDEGATWRDTDVTAKTYTETVGTDNDYRQVRCIVSDMYGASLTSDPATILCNRGITIRTQPENITTSVHQNVRMTVYVKNPKYRLTFVWQKKKTSSDNWVNVYTKKATYSWENYATYYFTTAQSDDNALVRCVISDGLGHTATTRTAKIRIIPAVQITKQPADVTAASGSQIKFSVTATGYGTLHYQWQLSDDDCLTWRNSSVQTAVYYTTLTQANNHRHYRCIVTDDYGTSTTSATAQANIDSPFAITQQPTDYMGKLGSTVKFTVKANGEGLTYQWQLSDDNGTNWRNSSVTDATYYTTLSEKNNGRTVRCIVSDKNGGKVISNSAKMKEK